MAGHELSKEEIVGIREIKKQRDAAIKAGTDPGEAQGAATAAIRKLVSTPNTGAVPETDVGSMASVSRAPSALCANANGGSK